MSIKPRLNRLFGADGKCFDVAIDHGFFNEWALLAGIEDMQRVIKMLVQAGPDAIQLTPGQARLLQELPGPAKPALVLRTDTANVYGKTLPRHVFSQMIDDPVEQALVLDAACVVVNLLWVPDQPELYHQCVANICRLKPLCQRYGMPLMIEPLVMQPNEKAGGYMTDGTLEKIVPLVRQAVELGADVIKADPCNEISQYPKVIETASGVPVLVRGGGRVSEEQVLARTKQIMAKGAAGIVYGRNVIQHPHPDRMTRALMAVVHDDVEVSQALEILAGK